MAILNNGRFGMGAGACTAHRTAARCAAQRSAAPASQLGHALACSLASPPLPCAATGGGIRKLIQLAGEYANNRVQFGRPISQFGLIQEKFGRMAIDAYVCER